ncbi:arginine/serine-rich coiled-coil protein 2 isoform X2 [Diachasma alloeum]|uniref:arginine/serine-rich coiled-coil protein 2 isoform X2 n=1 Tax=Diachasma alloeum TaxID=454923 RepID=UPI0007382669|nr:arginine/serine-rich coiled-coil protein 2 isoform X2 [Diachasma alloeum]
MDSLINYGSDGENSDNSEDTKTPQTRIEVTERRASDVNYDPVQMDMSEDSNNNNSTENSGSERGRSPQDFHVSGRSARGRSSPEHRRTPDHHTSRDDSKREKSDRSRQEERSRRETDERRRDTDSRDYRDRKSRDDDRRPREDDRRSSKRDESRRDERDRSDKDYHKDHHRDSRRNRKRERDRRHSRTDRKDRHRDDRSSHHKEKDRERIRSRSRSKDRPPAVPFRSMSYREEKGRNKLAQLEKLGIELKTPEGNPVTPSNMEQSFYNPLATATQGKYAEQIQKRKLLWANKSKPDEGQKATTVTGSNTWVGTTFTHDQDGKMTAKFKRLMGIKGDASSVPQTTGSKPDILKKQEEMFTNMEQQYEVARATTHTQRGVGLGYASGGYQFPR